MKLTSRIALITAFGTVAASSLFAAPAMAAIPLPTCVGVRHTAGIVTQTVYVTNHCRYKVRFYIDKEGPNLGCYDAYPGRSISKKFQLIDAYHGTYRC